MVKHYRIIVDGAFLQSRRFVIRRFVVPTFCSSRRFVFEWGGGGGKYGFLTNIKIPEVSVTLFENKSLL
jgi:hypothetical protein